MSAWGVGPFENDDALDFLGEVEESARAGQLDSVSRPLQQLAFSAGYLEAPLISEGIAAAALLGAALRPSEAADEPSAPDWVGGLAAGDVPNELVEVARRALRRALHPDNNELHDLWSESDGLADWQSAVRRVLGWLGDRDD